MKQEQIDYGFKMADQVGELHETLRDCLDEFNDVFGDSLEEKFQGKSIGFYRNELISAKESLYQFCRFLSDVCHESMKSTPRKPFWLDDEPRCPHCSRNIEHIIGYLDGKSVCECGQHINWDRWEMGNDA